MKKILDACCGSRMFWFNKENPDVDFCDVRILNEKLCDGRTLEIKPDIVCDFTDLPMKDNTYHLVVFDPPHLIRVGKNSWLCQKYGKLPKDNWQEILSEGFGECMRVLKPNGVLIFKWNETDVPVSKIIDVVGQIPLFGHRSGKREKTHWLCFMKSDSTEKGGEG
jgi:ubiquinone/menaquinone biosynthesis C-methylase UbiE